ncbi:MAG: hypothetical protein Q8K15_04960, partial [Candidatus Omnitrophota bacterium]|nr:hypothetical protein [Candidatus Omnitrophota bacterium]
MIITTSINSIKVKALFIISSIACPRESGGHSRESGNPDARFRGHDGLIYEKETPTTVTSILSVSADSSFA